MHQINATVSSSAIRQCFRSLARRHKTKADHVTDTKHSADTSYLERRRL